MTLKANRRRDVDNPFNQFGFLAVEHGAIAAFKFIASQTIPGSSRATDWLLGSDVSVAMGKPGIDAAVSAFQLPTVQVHSISVPRHCQPDADDRPARVAPRHWQLTVSGLGVSMD